MSLLGIPLSQESIEPRFKSLEEPRLIDINSEYAEDKLFNNTLMENLRILREVKLPDRFSSEQIERHFSDLLTSWLKEDDLFQAETQICRYTKALNQYLLEYFGQIYTHLDNVMRHLQGKILGLSSDFLDSDFPPAFLRTVSLSLKTEQRYEAIYKKKVRREEAMLRLHVNNHRKFKRTVDDHNAWVDRIYPFVDDMRDQYIGLLWFVDIWNSVELNDLFEEKEYRMANLDEVAFEEMLKQLESMTQEVRRRLVNLDREEFLETIRVRDPTISLFTDSVTAFNEYTP